MGRWDVVRKAAERTVSSLWAQMRDVAGDGLVSSLRGPQARRKQSAIEPLESRTLFSVDWSLNDRVLTVQSNETSQYQWLGVSDTGIGVGGDGVDRSAVDSVHVVDGSMVLDIPLDAGTTVEIQFGEYSASQILITGSDGISMSGWANLLTVHDSSLSLDNATIVTLEASDSSIELPIGASWDASWAYLLLDNSNFVNRGNFYGSSTFQMSNGATVVNEGDWEGALWAYGGAVINNGVMTSGIQMHDGATFDNYGTATAQDAYVGSSFINHVGATLYWGAVIDGPGVLTSYGTMEVPAGTSTGLTADVLIIDGTLNVQSGAWILAQDPEDGNILTIDDGTLENDGYIWIRGAIDLVSSGALHNTGTIDMVGPSIDSSDNTGEIVNDGSLNLTGTGWELQLRGIQGIGDVRVDEGVVGSIRQTSQDSITVDGSLKFIASTGNQQVFVAESLSVSWLGTLDLTNNALIIRDGASSLATLTGLIASGYASGAWSGLGIISSTAQSNPAYGIGIADAGSLGITSFKGISVSSTDVIICYTRNGDANLDGAITIADYDAWETGNVAPGATWSTGDFDYDGDADGDDLEALLPVPVAGSYVASESGSVSLDGTDSFEISGALTYDWDLDGDGIYGETGGMAGRGDETGATPLFSAVGLDGPSTYSIGLRVTNSTGRSNVSAGVVSIINTPPIAALVNSGPVDEGTTAIISFTDISDASADISAGFTYSFDFNDDGDFADPGEVTDSSNSSITVPSSYLLDGPTASVVRGRITDVDGGFADFSTSITVGNVAPILGISGFETVNEGETYELDWSSWDTALDEITSWLIHWGDGTEETVTGEIRSGEHVFEGATTGVWVRATDEDGSYTSSTISVAIVPKSPTGLSASVMSGQVQLTWTDESLVETGFVLERKLGSDGPWSAVASIDEDATSFTDTTVSAGATYTYRLRSERDAESSGWNTSASVTVSPGSGGSSVPFVATSLRVVNNVGTSGAPETNDLLIAGQAAGGTALGGLLVQYDINGDGSPDGSTTTDSSGAFVIDLRSNIPAEGVVTARVRIGSVDPLTSALAFGTWASFTFTYSRPSGSSGGEPIPVLPPGTAEAVYPGGPTKPSIANYEGTSATSFVGGSIFGGSFASYGSRFNPTGGSTFTQSTVDSDGTAVITSYTTSAGTYTVSHSDLSEHHRTSVYVATDDWSYNETYVGSYLIETSFDGLDGSTSHLVQSGTFEYTLEAGTTATGVYYTASEGRLQSYVYNWWSSSAAPTHTYQKSSSEGFAFGAGGTLAVTGTGTTTDETITYLATGGENIENTGEAPDGSWSNGDSQEVDWSYNVGFEKDVNEAGAVTSIETFLYHEHQAHEFDNKSKEVYDTTTTSGGKTVHSYGDKTSSLSGNTEVDIDVNGVTQHFGDGTWASDPRVQYVRTTDDLFVQTSLANMDVTDASVTGVSVSSTSTTTTSLTSDRHYHQENDGKTTIVNGSVELFKNTTEGNNHTDANWFVSSSSDASGTDTSTAGITRDFTSSRSSTDNGTSSYDVESSGSYRIDSSGVTVTGSTVFNYKSDGTTTWSNDDEGSSSGKTETSIADGAMTTTIDAESSSSDVGNGEYHTVVTSTSTADSEGVITQNGTSSNTSKASGTLTDHVIQNTTVETVQEAEGSGIKRTSMVFGEAQEDPTSTYTTESSMNTTFTESSSFSIEKFARHDVGTTKTSRRETNESIVEDSNTTGKTTNSDTVTSFESTENGIVESDSTAITTIVDGAVSWEQDFTSKGSGDSTTKTVTDISSITEETETEIVEGEDGPEENEKFHEKTAVASHYDNTSTGKYVSTVTSHSEGDGTGSSSSQTTASTDGGTYKVNSDSHVKYLKDDKRTSLITHSDFTTDQTFNGNGSYSVKSDSTSNSTSDGKFCNHSTSSSVNDDTGSSTFDSKSNWSQSGSSEDSEYGGEDEEGETVPNTDVYDESRTGTTKSHSSKATELENKDGKYWSTSTETGTWEDIGTSTWNQTTDTQKVTVSEKDPSHTRYSKAKVHYHGEGEGTYEKHFNSESNHQKDGTWETHSSGTESHGGTSDTTTVSDTLSKGVDKEANGTISSGWNITNSTDKGKGTYETFTSYSNDRETDGTTDDFITTTSKSKSDSTSNFTATSGTTVDGDVTDTAGSVSYQDASGNGATVPITRQTKYSATGSTSRTGEGTAHSEGTDTSTTTNGKTSTSHVASQTGFGTFSGSSESTKDVVATQKAGEILDGSSHDYTYNYTTYSDGSYTSNMAQESATSVDGKSSSMTYDKYSEKASFTTDDQHTSDGKSKVYISKKTDHYNDTTENKSSTTSKVTDGFYSDSREDLHNSYMDGTSTTYHQDEHYSEGNTDNKVNSSQKVNVHFNTLDDKGTVKRTTDTKTEVFQETHFTEGKYTSWLYNEWSTDKSGETTTNGGSEDTSEGNYTFESRNNTDGTEKTPGTAGTDPYVGNWTSKNHYKITGSGTYSSSSDTDTVDGFTTSHSESTDDQTGTYKHEIASTASITEKEHLIKWGENAASRDSNASSSSTTTTNGTLTITTTTSSDSDSDGWSSSDKTVTEKDKGKTDWSETSSENATETGTIPNYGSVTKTSTPNSTESGTDNFDLTTTTTTFADDGDWETTVSYTNSTNGNNTWNSSTNNTGEAVYGDKTSSTVDTSTDTGSANYTTTYNGSTSSSSLFEGEITTGTGTSTVNSSGNYSTLHSNYTNVKESTSTTGSGLTVKQGRGEVTVNKLTGNYTSEGTVTTTVAADGEKTYSGSATVTDHNVKQDDKGKSVTVEVEGDAGTWYWELNYDEETVAEQPFIDPHTPHIKNSATDYKGTRTIVTTDTTTTLAMNADGSTSDSTEKTVKVENHTLQASFWNYRSHVESNGWETYSRGSTSHSSGPFYTEEDGTKTDSGNSTKDELELHTKGSGDPFFYNTPSGPPSLKADHYFQRTIEVSEEEPDVEKFSLYENLTHTWAGHGPAEWLFDSGTYQEIFYFEETSEGTRSPAGETLTKLTGSGGNLTVGSGYDSSWTYTIELVGDHMHRVATQNGVTGEEDLPLWYGAATYLFDGRYNLDGYRALEYGIGDTIINWIYDTAGVDVYEVSDKLIEGAKTAADGFFGFVDGALESLNPFGALGYNVPDIGPVFGHTTAYGVGQVVGTVAGVAASFMIGNVASGASGLVACGSALQTAAKIYTATSTVVGFGAGVVNIAQGKAGLGDYLAVASGAASGIGWAAGKLSGVQYCFVAGTEVLVGAALAPGVFSQKNIEDIGVGDEVWSRNENNPEAPMELKKVTAVFQNTAYDLQKVSVRDEHTGNIEVINATDEHPFFVENRGWIAATELQPGQYLMSSDGHRLTVIANADDKRPEGVTVYNFAVEDNHTYFVADGSGQADQFIWIHNACSNSYELGTNLGNAQAQWAKGYAAHHIVPSTAAAGKLARRILKEVGIKDLNQAVNGVWLAKNKAFSHLGGAIHSTVHTKAYYKEITRRLKAVRGDREGVEEVLGTIRSMLEKGTFPIN